jgi:hypothetical protein
LLASTLVGKEARRGTWKTCARANRCTNRAHGPSHAHSTVRSCPVPQGIGASWMKRHEDERTLAGNSTRWKASRVVPPFSPLWRETLLNGEDGGAILVRRVKSTSRANRWLARRKLPVGLEATRWCPRTTGDARGRDDFGEGSFSRRKRRPSAGGQHPERREALPRCTPERGSSRPMGSAGERGCIELGSDEAGASE